MESEYSPELRRPRRKEPTPGLDRLPPHAPEAEQAILGAILLEPPCINEVIHNLAQVGSAAFYDLRHGAIYDALILMNDRVETINVITLMQHLKDKQMLEQIGGVAYLSALPECCPSAAGLPDFLNIVLKKYKLRQMIRTCTEAVGRIYDSELDPDQVLDDVERRVMEVRQTTNVTQGRDVRQVVVDCITRIEEFHGRKGSLLGLPTGFHDLDRLTGGLVAGDYYLLAGRPSMGKTSLAMNIVEHVAIEFKVPVGVFSLEMSVDSLIMRMLCSRSRVNLRNIRDGFMAERDYPRLTHAAGQIANSMLHVDDSSGLSIMELRARARRMHQQHGIKLFVIDYVQLLVALMNGRRPDKRDREVSEVSSGLKALAKELKVPVVVVSQLSRELDRQKRAPVLADLRESGSLEQDADMVGMLYKPFSDDDNDPAYDEAAYPVNLIVAKQRNGPTGEIPLVFLKPYTRFESSSRVPDPGEENLDYPT